MSDVTPLPDHEPRAEPKSLAPGTRLTTGERDVYEVIGLAWQGPRQTFHHARKSLWNYRFADRAMVEADEDEQLNVLVRVPRDAGQGGANLAFELDILNRIDVPSLAEPLDVLSRDGSGSPSILVLSDPRGVRLSERPIPEWRDAAPLLRLARELLGLLDALHRHGLTADGIDPADLMLDGDGHLLDLGTDRIATGSPEAARADLDHWAAFASRLLLSLRLDPPGTIPDWSRAAEPRPVPPPGADGQTLHDFNRLAACVERCLSPRPEDGPVSFIDLLSRLISTDH